MWNRLLALLGTPVSGASLAVFRIVLGAVMLYEAYEFLKPSFYFWPQRGENLVYRLYTGEHVNWTFPYPGFEWVRPLPEPFTSLLVGLFGLAALLVTLGVVYRPAMATLCATFAYINLMEESWYLNHFYLGVLLAFLLIWMPADRRFALANLWRRDPSQETAGGLVPFWCVILLRAQLFIVYFYAGIAKLNADWLAGEPVRMWLRDFRAGEYLEQFLAAGQMAAVRSVLRSEAFIALVAYGGLVFDLAIGFLLIFRRTRLLALVLVAIFHGINFCLLNIGAFPVLAMGLTLIFLDPDWPLRLVRRGVDRAGALAASASGRVSWAVPTLIGVWLLVQVIVPLRHFVIPGNVHWTDEGSRFSWHMMLRNKEPGYLEFRVHDPQLIVDGGDGGSRIDWEAWQGPRPSRIYAKVDAGHVDWTQMPEVFITYEPYVGERIFFNPAANDARSAAEGPATQRVAELWEATYQRQPIIYETMPTAEALARLRDDIEQAVQDGRPVNRSTRLHAHIVAMLAAQLAEEVLDDTNRYLRMAQLQTLLQLLLKDDRWRPEVLRYLSLAQPLSIQGAAAPAVPLLTVRDPALLRSGYRSASRVVMDAWRDSPRVYVDFSRMLPAHLTALEPLLVTEDTGGEDVQILWNYAVDLHTLQCRSLQSFPAMQHQYAQRIAGLWEEQYGRRPQVFVTSSLALNQHPMQPITDPTVDLSAVPLRLLSHNEWILPHNRGSASSVAGRGNAPLASGDSSPSDRTADRAADQP